LGNAPSRYFRIVEWVFIYSKIILTPLIAFILSCFFPDIKFWKILMIFIVIYLCIEGISQGGAILHKKRVEQQIIRNEVNMNKLKENMQYTQFTQGQYRTYMDEDDYILEATFLSNRDLPESYQTLNALFVVTLNGVIQTDTVGDGLQVGNCRSEIYRILPDMDNKKALIVEWIFYGSLCSLDDMLQLKNASGEIKIRDTGEIIHQFRIDRLKQ
jgi:uncharacterized membrane protein